MASNDTDIQLRIRAAVEGLAEISKLITEVDTLGGETESSSEQVGSLGDELQRLGEQNATLTQFANLKRSTADLGEGLEDARTRATGMGKALADAKKELTASNAAYSASRQETERLASAHAEAKAKVDLLRQANSEATSVTKEQRQALKDARDQVRLLGDQYRESAGQTNALKNGLDASEKALRQQAREFNSARREVQSLDSQYQRQNTTLNGLRRALTEAGVDTRKLASEQKRIETASQQAGTQVAYLKSQLAGQAGQLRSNAAGMEAYSKKAKQAEQNTEQLHEAVQSGEQGWAALAGKITGVAAAFLSFDQLAARTTGMVRTADEIERLGVSLKSVEGSAAGGEKALAWLREFNEKTPFQLNEITTAFIKAKNFGLDPYNGVLQATANYTAKTAGTYQDLEGVITALGQAYVKGKLQAEEMNQLNERSVAAAKLLAKAMGKTTDEIIAMATAGKLGRNEIELLIKVMGEDAAGASEEMAQTFSGIWSNFLEQLNQVELAVADAGIFAFIKSELAEVTAQIKATAADGSLATWAQGVSDGMRSGAIAIRGITETLVEMRDGIGLVVKVWGTMKVIQWSSQLLGFGQAMKTGVVQPTAEAGKELDKTSKKAVKLNGVLGALTLGNGAVAAGLSVLVYEGGKGLAKLAEDAGGWAAKMGEAEQRVAEQSRAFFAQLQRQGMTTLAQFDEFKNVQILTAQEVAKLSATERAAYEQRLKGHREYLTGQLQVQKALEASGLKAEAMHYQADAALASMRQGFVDLAAGADQAGKAIDDKTRPAVLKLVADFDMLKAKGKETSTGINEMFKGLQMGDPTSLQNITLALESLREQGKVTQTEIDAGLRKSLQDMSLQDLELLKVQSMAAFDTMKNGAISTAQITESVLSEKLRRLGVDYQALHTGIDAVGRQTIDTFRAVATDVNATSQDIAAAMKAAVNKADTAQELEELRKVWLSVGLAGKVSAQEQGRGLTYLDEHIRQTKAKAAEIGDSFNTAADKSKKATDTMRENLKGVQDEAKKTKADVEDAISSTSGGSSALSGTGRGDVTRTVGAGAFFYKTVDINQLRGNADALANTLAGVEDELARYSQKVRDIPAYSEWSKYYGEKFQKEMEAMRAQLQKELNKAQQKEVEKATPQPAAGPTQSQQQQSASAPSGSNKTVTIYLKSSTHSAEVQSDEENLDALLRLLKQQGLRS
ncbi:tape measure protein [Aeromonas dhakensis]|uniref:tape measure protein n=1 Tax=Aeromonas dhakensis TaxID=196024 RepID=UPI001F62269A|nr:tape measure protein [Aeromonas dhakensis]UNU87902.1 tape measure protein [Aeromonas dhakensis]